MGDLRAHDVALGHLNARGFIQFHPLLAQRLDSFKAAIFLGHALYWSRYLAQAQPHRRGWFFMSAAQWREATGLSTHEQTSVRGELARRGLLEEALAGRPAILHFRVNLQATASFLGLEQLTWVSMGELFRSCIRFYKPLSDICGGVSAGLYLSYLLQRQSFALRNPLADTAAVELFPGEFSYRPEQARIALCLGIKAQRNAREKLKAAGFIREGRATNEVVATRVNLAAIASCLQAQDKPVRKRPTRKQTAPAALAAVPAVPAPKQGKPAKGPVTGLSRSALPQQQLTLFSPVGLARPLPLGPRSTTAESAPATDGATPAPTAQAEQLIRSLFAPSLVARDGFHPESAAGPSTGDSAQKLSTAHLSASAEFALFENPICPFLDVNLPFFKNYKEQGISRYLQTTTTAPVDNSAGGEPGRRRVENSEIQKSETAVDQKIDGNGANCGHAADLAHNQGVGSTVTEKSPVGPENQSEQSANEIRTQAAPLILPERLDHSHHAGVLATVGQAPQDLQQAFLDELAGHLAIPNKVIHNPTGWLHGLIRKHQSGFVALALAPQIAELRQRRQRHEERLANAGTAQPDLVPAREGEPESADVDHDSEVRREHRQRLQELRAAFVAKRGDPS